MPKHPAGALEQGIETRQRMLKQIKDTQDHLSSDPHENPPSPSLEKVAMKMLDFTRCQSK